MSSCSPVLALVVVHGCGVTDVTHPGMYHMAYVDTTLTSPNGRKAHSGMRSAPNSVRADVSLSFMPTDMGDYGVDSTDEGYCYRCQCYILNMGSNASVLNYTAIQHSYPTNPLPKPCWISSFFDAVRNAHAHHAEDVIYDNGQGTGGTTPPYGAAVYAMEAGKVIAENSSAGPAPGGYPSCVGTGSPGNYVKIQAVASTVCSGSSGDNYSTIYFHVKPSVSNRQCVSAGQQIGTLDNSGCQSGAHAHIARKDTYGNPVNFALPCTYPTPSTKYFDGLVDDSVPDNL